MLYILAKNRAEADQWRRKAGLPRSHVRYISEYASRGCTLRRHEIVQLEGFAANPRRRQIERAIAPALIPAGFRIPAVINKED